MSASVPVRSVVLGLCRRGAVADDVETAVARASRARIDEYLRFAGEHRLHGLVLSSLAARRPDLPDLAETERHLRRSSFVQEARTALVVATFGESGIRPTVLKGDAIAGLCYPQRHHRHQADLDLLVAPTEIDRAVAALEHIGYSGPRSRSTVEGYRRFHFHIPMGHADGHVVELHWRLNRPGAPFDLDPEIVRSGARELGNGPDAILVPRSEHLLLHMVIQNLQEGFSRLSRVVDLDRIVALDRGPDWGEVVTRAREGGLRAATAVSLRLAQTLLGAPVPTGVVHDLRPGPLARAHLAWMRPTDAIVDRRFADTWASSVLLGFWLSDGLAGKRRLLNALRSEDRETEIRLDKRRGGLPGYAWRMAKLPVAQAWIQARALGTWLTAGSASLRFWTDRPDA